jgi:hypothetical protein
MENVKYIRSEENEYVIDLYFKISDGLADLICKKCGKKVFRFNFDKNNQFCYTISRTKKYEDIKNSMVETIEKISNEGDEEHFFNHLITDNGQDRSPREIHDLMSSEYGLADISKDGDENTDTGDADLEWWTAHFFIQFGSRLFNEDISASDGDGMIWAAAGESEVSDYLDVLDSIDKIIVVDDVRKYGPEDIKKMYDELDSNK